MSSKASSVLVRVAGLAGAAAADVGGVVAGAGVPDDDQAVHEHREGDGALDGEPGRRRESASQWSARILPSGTYVA